MKIFCLFATVGMLTLPLGAQSNPLSAGNKGIYAIVKNNVIKAAEKMPAENYAFRPADTIRTFGQIVGHIADAQYLFCSVVLGEKNPTPGIEKGKTSKDDLVKGLKDAFAYCDKAYDGLTDAHAADIVKFFGRDQPKLSVLSFSSA